MTFLNPDYDGWLVGISLLIATFASFVALDLAKRVRSEDRHVAMTWGIGGSLAMGSGVWAMHFVGMMAFSLPIEIGYTVGLTALSWLAAIAASGVGLSVASRGRLSPRRLAVGSLAMGGGICAMHYIGMAALDLSPGIVWQPWLIAASAAIAVAASAAALGIFFLLRQMSDRHGLLYQVAASVVMGLAISGMHYTGMAAAQFPAGTVCLSAGQLGGSSLSGTVVMASLTMLVLTLFTSTLDGRLRDRTTQLAASLKAANDELTTANASLRTLAFRDPVTGLANRLLFEDRLQHAVAFVDRQHGGARLAVLFIDLDGFKPVNDTLGHAQGDSVLRNVAERLLATARESDTVARVGGDEFVLMVEHAGVADCTALAARIVTALSRPFEVADQLFSISASIGIVIYPDDGAADKLLGRADAAMYAAKRAGGASYALFEPQMDPGAPDLLNLRTDLRHAVERNELVLHYQPKIDAASGAVAGVEALLRWTHPQRGTVTPAVFIPIAERFGMIGALGDWVIDEACRQMGEWAAAGRPQRVAINLSVHQLRRHDIVERIQAALQRHRVSPADLLCEITESAVMDDLRTTGQVIDRLVGIGVYLSIDDFGTGYSSLSVLRSLPVRQLKIDRSFVNDLESSADARAVVHAVLGLAHALGLRAVAEGVETVGQRDILCRLGCDELQGFLYARPMPAAALLSWACAADDRRPSGQRAATAVGPASAADPPRAGEADRRAEHAA